MRLRAEPLKRSLRGFGSSWNNSRSRFLGLSGDSRLNERTRFLEVRSLERLLTRCFERLRDFDWLREPASWKLLRDSDRRLTARLEDFGCFGLERSRERSFSITLLRDRLIDRDLS